MKMWRMRIAAAFCLCGINADAQEETSDEMVLREYREYISRFEEIETVSDIELSGYRIFEEQVFPYIMESFGTEEVNIIPAIETEYSRIAIFIADFEGNILYKTNQLETNNLVRGQLEQPVTDLASIAFADVNTDGYSDIIIITTCVNSEGDYTDKPYKVGDVLFQRDKEFYRDYRISEKLNRFDMNKSANSIISYVRDGQSVEYLYTATTLEELLENGFKVFEEQSYMRNFEKLGRLKVVPGVAEISQYDVLMVFLVNEQGNIVWSFQPMGDYDNLYSLRGVSSGKDLDGDGLKDIVILARYSYEGDGGELDIGCKCSIYYQRTGGFDMDGDFQNTYQCTEEDTMEKMVRRIREYWGWNEELLEVK
ncbi:MAG: VCBS repeat-containing protein [Lachnospiraceae bacterium]|nr:VCBS repeat-containing protein [Lachnospiraceae bacterium]